MKLQLLGQFMALVNLLLVISPYTYSHIAHIHIHMQHTHKWAGMVVHNCNFSRGRRTSNSRLISAIKLVQGQPGLHETLIVSNKRWTWGEVQEDKKMRGAKLCLIQVV